APKGQAAVDKILEVAKNAHVTIDEGDPVKLADLPQEAFVHVKLSADLTKAIAIHAEGPGISGVVKGNAGNGSITVGNKESEQSYAVGKGTRVVLDDRSEGMLADLIDGTVVRGKLSADKKEVRGVLYAEGPSYRGIIKGVDADNLTITLTVGG